MKRFLGFSEVRTWRVVDGDTLDVTQYLGTGISVRQHIRLARINAPERGTIEGMQSAAWLETLLTRAGGFNMIMYDREVQDKYGRTIAELWYTYDGQSWHNLSDTAILTKHAQPHDYGRTTLPLGVPVRNDTDLTQVK